MLEALDILKNCCDEPPKKRTKKDKTPKEVPAASAPEAGATEPVPEEPSPKQVVAAGSEHDVAETLVEQSPVSPPPRLQSQRCGCIVYMYTYIYIVFVTVDLQVFGDPTGGAKGTPWQVRCAGC